MRGDVVRGVVIVLSALLAGGCAISVDARKSASIERAQVHEVAGVELARFARTHAAVLLTGADEATDVRVTKGNVQGLFRLNGEVCRTIGGGVAVPIDRRGYWLTAAHCVSSGAAVVVVPTADGSERAHSTRIVWMGHGPGQDLAILFAPLADGVVQVDVSHDVRMSARIVCVGSGIAADRFSAGRVVGVGGATDGSLVWLEHDAPLTFGDSGGPAFYEDGLLAGINVEAGATPSGDKSRATAIVPDMERLTQLIDDDWNRQVGSE